MKLDYAPPPKRLMARLVSWLGDDAAFDAFWPTFRRLLGFVLSVGAVWVIAQLGGSRYPGGIRGTPSENRLPGVLETAFWAVPLTVAACALYAWVGTRYSERAANLVGIACVLVFVAIPVARLWMMSVR